MIGSSASQPLSGVATTRSAFALVLLLIAPVALGAQDPAPPTLSLTEAITTARAHNPDFLAQANDSRTARAAVRSARADFLPSANLSNTFGYTAGGERRFGSVGLGEQPDYYSSQYSLGLSYDLSGAKLMQPRMARAQERATQQRILGGAADLASRVTGQYLAVLQGQDDVTQAEGEVARTVEHERLARAQLEVGTGIALDLRRAEVQRGQAEVRLLQTRSAVVIALLDLGQLLGRPVGPATRLTTEFTVFEPAWQVEELREMALSANPTLLAARASASAARTGVSAARSAYLPTLSFNLGLQGSVYRAGNIDPLVAQQLQGAEQRLAGCQQANALAALLGQPGQDCGAFSIDPQVVRDAIAAENAGFPFGYERQPLNASMTITLPIFNGLNREQRIEEAHVAAEDAAYLVQAQETRLRVELATTLRNLETAYLTAGLQERVRVNAEEELRMARERFRFGAASSIEVIDAQANLARAEQEKIAAVYEFHRALAGLETIVGQSLR